MLRLKKCERSARPRRLFLESPEVAFRHFGPAKRLGSLQRHQVASAHFGDDFGKGSRILVDLLRPRRDHFAKKVESLIEHALFYGSERARRQTAAK